jgi:formamidopyrimidine-DNA glycosylase
LLADEILWQAKVPPAMPVSRLPRADADQLYRTMRSVPESAIATGGANTGEVIAARQPGGTYPRDGAEVRQGTLGGRSTWWCSREQAWPAGASEPLPKAGSQR